MTTPAWSSSEFSLPDRDETRATVRAELRAAHRHLTDEQIDLIADVAVDLRLMSIRLAAGPLSGYTSAAA